MARTVPDFYTPIGPIEYGADQPIDGADEATIAQNINWIQASKVVPFAVHLFGRDPADMWSAPQTNGPGFRTVGSFRRHIQRDFPRLLCVAVVKNDNHVDDGVLRFRALNSGTSSQTTVAAGTASTVVLLQLVVDAVNEVDEVIAIDIEPPASALTGGALSIQSVSIYPRQLTDPLLASISTDGFVPMDTVNFQANAPLTTYQRRTQFQDLETLSTHRTGGTILSFTENADERLTRAWRVTQTDSNYQLVMSLSSVYVPYGVTKIYAAVQGLALTILPVGQLKITSNFDEAGSESSVFQTTWIAGDPNEAKWEIIDTIDVLPQTMENIQVFIKSNGVGRALLAGLVIWFDEAEI